MARVGVSTDSYFFFVLLAIIRTVHTFMDKKENSLIALPDF